jgi:L-ascorbate metabolism protein UlaG (beta-lactamase superfamily)
MLVGLAIVAGCTGSAGAAPRSSVVAPSVAPPATNASSPASPTAGPATTPTPPPTPTQTATPTPSIPAQGVVIVNEAVSQFELLSPGGVRVFVDVVYPDRVTAPPAAADIHLVTHLHDDHYDQAFVDAFPGKRLVNASGTVSSGDVRVQGIDAAHTEGDPLTGDGATDHIFVIRVGGLRVVVFGDLGQHRLTASQLHAIGRADVAISQLANAVSEVTALNKVAIGQMRQVAPAIFIPTHIDDLDAARVATETWPATTADSFVTLTRATLPAPTTVLFMGDVAAAYRKLFKLGVAGW